MTRKDTYYFLGIGGIGMSALARYLAAKGYRVLGYDRTPSSLTHQLEEEGISVQYDDSIEQLQSLDIQRTIVVRTPAIPEGFVLLEWFRQHQFQIVKRAELLGELTRSACTLSVAGTHGKTTTSTILAHILHQSHIGSNAILGGIACNYGSNLLLDSSDNFVVEADEFDRSFHQLMPYISVITSMDADHLDVYGTEQAYCESFEKFAAQVQHALVLKRGLHLRNCEDISATIYTYDVFATSCSSVDLPHFYADNIRVTNAEIYFDFHTPTHAIANVQLGVPVWVNVENAVAAMSVAYLMGVSDDELRNAVATFTGVHRRFNIHLNTPQVAYVDDYAHHPMELQACIHSVRMLYPERYVLGVFQPHLFTRTRDFADDFAQVLSSLDEIVLLPIYPAREEPIVGINSEWLLRKVNTMRALLYSPTMLPKFLHERVKRLLAEGKKCVVLTMGAGDIDRYTNEITTKLL